MAKNKAPKKKAKAGGRKTAKNLEADEARAARAYLDRTGSPPEGWAEAEDAEAPSGMRRLEIGENGWLGVPTFDADKVRASYLAAADAQASNGFKAIVYPSDGGTGARSVWQGSAVYETEEKAIGVARRYVDALVEQAQLEDKLIRRRRAALFAVLGKLLAEQGELQIELARLRKEHKAVTEETSMRIEQAASPSVRIEFYEAGGHVLEYREAEQLITVDERQGQLFPDDGASDDEEAERLDTIGLDPGAVEWPED